jgi:hypothetical protein
MNKKTLLSLIVFLNLALLPVCSVTSYAAWTSEDLGDVDNDLWAIWGSSAEDVYAVGTLGSKFYYDGNQAGEWLTLPSISP